MNGGYILIDCTGLDLIKGSTPQTISGLRSKVVTAMKTGKPIFAANCNWDGQLTNPLPVMALKIGTDIICTANTLQIYIDESDVVTIVNLVGD